MQFIWYPDDAGVPCAVCGKRKACGFLRLDGTHTYVDRECIEALAAALPPQ